VKPSWSRRKPARGQKVIVIDPGLSFGTGQHPTTRFCLEQIATRNREARQSLLDVGTGSGILAIAAAKLGYSPVRAFDFDPAAVRVARENVRKNRVAVTITRGDITKIPTGLTKYDVVCANLTADLLEGCAGKLKGFLKRGGWLVLAGILRAQADSVRQSFEKRGFCVTAQNSEGEWESLALRVEHP
jgi:ribosomal protein L11 methyltransferase